MEENSFQNCVTFHGILADDPIDVGGGYLAFKLIEEFPTILIKSTAEEAVNHLLKKGTKISAFGTLKNMGEWVILIIQLANS